METLKGKAAREYVDASVEAVEDMEEGEQVHVNDTTCGDKRGRLYVKRVAGGVLFCCHNCGNQGLAPIREIARISTTHKIVLSKAGHRASDWKNIYNYATSNWDEFPLEAQLWLNSYGFDDEHADKIGIRANDNGIILPIFSQYCGCEKVVQGIQIRNYSGKPKYVTYGDVENKPLMQAWISDYFYVVEDLLSAYKMYISGNTVVCNLGVKPPYLSLLDKLKSEGLKHVGIWFDPDEAGMMGAERWKQECGVHFKEAQIMSSDKQPKEIDWKVLRDEQ